MANIKVVGLAFLEMALATAFIIYPFAWFAATVICAFKGCTH